MDIQSQFESFHEARHRRAGAPLRTEKLPQEKETAEQQFFQMQDPFDEGRERLRVYEGLSRQAFAKRVEELQCMEVREAFERVCLIADEVQRRGGRALLVGGSVRDEIMEKPSKDFDLEVYRIEPSVLEDLLSRFGKVDSVGKAFGILKVTDGAIDIDVSIPRRDSKVHEGHRGFEVDTDPQMSITDAARRRDFTFNALSKDPLTGEIYDPFGGVEDLKTRTLRVTDTALFQDDPLRVMRGAQFMGRFELKPDDVSFELMRSMVPTLKELPKERMKEEWDKLLVKSERPSLALQGLFDLGIIVALYSELSALHGTPQEFEWHPEGDVWVHTLMVVDAAKIISKEHDLNEEQTKTLMYAALCHDLGKPSTTVLSDGRIRAHAHEPAGEKPTRDFLKKLGTPKELEEKVVALVKEHLWTGTMHRRHVDGEVVSDGAFRRLAKRISPATIAELTFVSEADSRGRGPFLDPKEKDQFLMQYDYTPGPWVRERAKQLGVEEKKPPTLIRGNDLLVFGFTPGPAFRELIQLADDLRDEREWSREQVLAVLADAQNQNDGIDRLKTALTTAHT